MMAESSNADEKSQAPPAELESQLEELKSEVAGNLSRVKNILDKLRRLTDDPTNDYLPQNEIHFDIADSDLMAHLRDCLKYFTKESLEDLRMLEECLKDPVLASPPLTFDDFTSKINKLSQELLDLSLNSEDTQEVEDNFKVIARLCNMNPISCEYVASYFETLIDEGLSARSEPDVVCSRADKMLRYVISNKKEQELLKSIIKRIYERLQALVNKISSCGPNEEDGGAEEAQIVELSYLAKVILIATSSLSRRWYFIRRIVLNLDKIIKQIHEGETLPVSETITDIILTFSQQMRATLPKAESSF